jgi:colanic acid/amylovoran biosynthesis glycosyltransferase
MKNNNPVVVHLMRQYLAPTETFIHNQMAFLGAYRPFVICHRMRNGVSPPADYDVFSAVAHMRGFPQAWANLAYELLRYLPANEIGLMEDAINDVKAKLLHFHYAVDARYFLGLKKRIKLPSLVSLYGYDISLFPRLYFGLGSDYLKPIFASIDRFIAMSNDMKKDLVALGCPEDKIIVHYYGVECDRFADPKREYPQKDVLNILMCGTLEIKKAQHLVLAALHEIDERKAVKVRFQVTIIGDGPMRSTLVNMVEQYGLQKRVRFCGHIPYDSDILIEEFSNADIFALPSITVKGDKEGIPGTIVEAMAAGLPVISSCHAGIPEIISNGVHGILVQEKDHQGLVDALAALIENHDLREKMGRAAARKATGELDARKRILDLERIYEDMLG